MKASTVLAFTVAGVGVINAKSYSEVDQAIWVDRHNYFRNAGLPWSASNMRRMDWDPSLATKAAMFASYCSATGEKGVNVFLTSRDPSSAIDKAIEKWVVKPALSTIRAMPQPGSSGLDVGKGFYNSYSQVVWASTSSVGCASQKCKGKNSVVCMYSPAGNDGKSSWYNHAEQGSDCPDGTVVAQGLCVKKGGNANNEMAAIPDGRWTYQVFPDFVSDVQSVLLKSAQDAANGIEPTFDFSSDANWTSSSTLLRETLLSKQDDNDQTTEKAKSGSNTGSTSKSAAKAKAAEENAKLANTNHGHEHGHGAANATTAMGFAGMFFIGVAATAGVIMLVHFTKKNDDDHH